jgi:formylglycine-generating enzyme required for sulfatase activity
VAHDVFISYSTKDRAPADAIYRYLKSQGIGCWMAPHDVPAGAIWPKVIPNAIRECQVLVLLLTAHSNVSEDVANEVHLAFESKKQVIVVRLEEISLSDDLVYYLGRRHHLSGVGIAAEELHAQLVVSLRGLLPEAHATVIKNPDLPPTYTNSIDMEFVLIPAGEFRMGSEKGFDDEKPVHPVRITKPFYLGKYPVTVGQWTMVDIGKAVSHKSADHPKVEVSWKDVQEFIEKLNRMHPNEIHRLTTEAEWEYACRAGTTTEYFFGDDPARLGEYAWYSENVKGSTHPVGQKKPNPWGLYDILGNVWEWVGDWYGPYEAGPAKGKFRVWRGGGFANFGRIARCASRDVVDLYDRDGYGVFRVALLPPDSVR